MRYFLILIVALLFTVTLNAQVHVNINLNSQPVWGPTGYDYVENYYFPDMEVYYNVPTHHYYYNQKGRWISSATLPARYHSFDLYNAHKVVINDKQPWKNHTNYKDKYDSFKGKHDQQPIRDSKESKYFSNKNHPEHNNWVKQQKHDNGHGKDHGNGKGPGHDKNK